MNLLDFCDAWHELLAAARVYPIDIRNCKQAEDQNTVKHGSTRLPHFERDDEPHKLEASQIQVDSRPEEMSLDGSWQARVWSVIGPSRSRMPETRESRASGL